jgi:hypothetical protein
VATVNYSVPDGVKKAFDRAFANENKSAVVAPLLRKAVEDRDLGNGALERWPRCLICAAGFDP